MSDADEANEASHHSEPSVNSASSKTNGEEISASESDWGPDTPISSESLSVVAEPRRKDLSDVDVMSDTDDDQSDSISDNNDEHCSKCHSNSNPGSLLCCDGCPRVYHLHCLEPKLARIPSGKWYCSDCESALDLADVDKILCERKNPSDKGLKQQGSQFYVKWKDKSYRHCTWVQKDHFLIAKKFFPGFTPKLKSFQARDQNDIDLEGYDPQDFINGVHRNWLKVDRILESRGVHHSSYFVKWMDLSYDQCTWEAAEDIQDAKDKIQAFHKQVSIRQEARKRLGVKNLRQMRLKTATDGQEEMFTSTPSFLTGGELHPYQLEGLNWLKFKWHQQENTILADEMGLGKTIQAIAFLTYLWTKGVTSPHLVVVPLSTMQNWLREFEIWAPQLKVIGVMGNKTCRDTVLKHELYLAKNLKSSKYRVHNRENLNRRVKCHVILVSYEMVSLESTRLSKLDFECLIVDEGHRLKAKSSKLVKELNNLSFCHRLLLTGTPLQNNIQELFALLHFLDARKFDSWDNFEADFSEISQEDQVKRLHGLLLPHLLRRLKKDVLKHLPPKKEQMVRVEMSDTQRTMYKSILAQNYEILTIANKKSDEVKRGLLSIATQLRKCCMHPYLFDGVEQYSADKAKELQQLIQASGKLELLDKMLETLIKRGHRVLVYSQYVITLNILEDYLDLKKIGHLRIDGKIGGSERQILIDRFNREPEKYSVFLLSTRAGGLGINLATADTVVLYDSDYNPHNDIQAQARAHRLGQKKPVMIYRLITRLTIEERMMQLAKEKLVLEQIVVRKLGHLEFKQAELDGILKYGAAELFADDRLADKQRIGGTVTDQERERLLSATNNAKIVYDEEAIEKLLDRSNMQTEEGDKMEVDNGELMAGFKIANFDIVARNQPTEESWEDLLKNREDVQKMLREKREKEKGHGGRRRRVAEMTYKIDDGHSDGSPDSDFDVAEHEGEDEDSSSCNLDLEPDVRIQPPAPPVKSTKRKEQPAMVEPAKKKPVQVEPGIPVLSTRGTELLVFGFGRKERHLFLNLLLRFGFPDEGQGAWEEFKSRLPRKRHQSIDDYAKTLVAAAGGAPLLDVSLQDFLFDCKPENLMTRIGTIHLFKERIRALEGKPTGLFSNPESCKQLYNTEFWKEAHDCSMLRNMVKHGYGRWKDILCAGKENLEEVLCKELKIEIPKSTKIIGEVIEIDISTSSEGEHQDIDEKTKRTKPENPLGDPAALKAKIRSSESKCRNWLVSRLKQLAAALTADQTKDFTKSNGVGREICQPDRVKSLQVDYQRMVRHCALIRESSSLVFESRACADILAAGALFRKQLGELEHIASSLMHRLPPSYDKFVGQPPAQSTPPVPVESEVKPLDTKEDVKQT